MSRLFLKGAFALAFIASSLLVLVPVCSAAEDHATETACCAALDEARWVDSSAAIGWNSKPDSAAAPLFVLQPFVAFPPACAAAVACSAAPPPRLSYYARSARILS